jgi:hypothetical protein
MLLDIAGLPASVTQGDWTMEIKVDGCCDFERERAKPQA